MAHQESGPLQQRRSAASPCLQTRDMQGLSFSSQRVHLRFLGILLSFIVHPVLDNSLLAQKLCGYFQVQKPASLCCVFSRILGTQPFVLVGSYPNLSSVIA
jgi:hypothetical protein